MKTKDLLQILSENHNKIEIGKLGLSISSTGDLDVRFNGGNLIGWVPSSVLAKEEELASVHMSVMTDAFADPEIKEKHKEEIKNLEDIQLMHLAEIEKLKRELALKEGLGDDMKIKDGMIQAYERILLRPTTLGKYD